MALKYTHVCLFNIKITNSMIHEFGPEHGKMSLIQSYQKYIISLKTL